MIFSTIDDFTGHGGHKVSDLTDKVLPTWNLHLRNGEAIFFVGEGDPLDLPLKFGQHAIMLLSCWFDRHPLYY